MSADRSFQDSASLNKVRPRSAEPRLAHKQFKARVATLRNEWREGPGNEHPPPRENRLVKHGLAV